MSTSRVGSERARVWIHEVLTPLIEGLRRETEILPTGGSTWRFHKRDFEFIGPPRFYLGPTGLDVLEDDLARVHPEVVRDAQRHEKVLEVLRAAATDCFVWLVEKSDLRSVVEALLVKYRTEGGGAADRPTGAYPESALADLVAERLINNVSDLAGGFYADAGFWRFAKPILESGGYRAGSFEPLASALPAAAADAEKWLRALRGLRARYVDRFGIPVRPRSA